MAGTAGAYNGQSGFLVLVNQDAHAPPRGSKFQITNRNGVNTHCMTTWEQISNDKQKWGKHVPILVTIVDVYLNLVEHRFVHGE